VGERDDPMIGGERNRCGARGGLGMKGCRMGCRTDSTGLFWVGEGVTGSELVFKGVGGGAVEGGGGKKGLESGWESISLFPDEFCFISSGGGGDSRQGFVRSFVEGESKPSKSSGLREAWATKRRRGKSGERRKGYASTSPRLKDEERGEGRPGARGGKSGVR